MVESSALLKRHTPKGYRGFESLPHRFPSDIDGVDSLMGIPASRQSLTSGRCGGSKRLLPSIAKKTLSGAAK